MKWNQPPKKAVNPACASDMTFVKPSHGDVPEVSKSTGRSAFDPRRTEDRVLHKERLQQLVVHLEKTVPNTGLMQFWQPGHSGSQVHIETLWQHVIFSHQHASTVVQEKFFVPEVAQCYDYLRDMTISSDEAAKIEEATRGQGENDLWIVLRNGRITSSRFGEILHRRESTNPRRLVRDFMGYGGPMTILPPQIRWGKENEDKARKCYIDNRHHAGETMIVEDSGLHLMPEKAYLGASSDGKVTCTSVDTCCSGCLEIKCPYSIDKCITVEMTPGEIADKFGEKFFLKRGEDGELHLSRQHRYFAQVQGELAVMNREWCDFVVYSNGEVVVDRILADLEYWGTLEEKLEEFYVRYMVPEILSGRIFLEEYQC